MATHESTPQSLAEWADLAEAQLAKSGSFFMANGTSSISGHDVLAALKTRHPNCEIQGVPLTVEQVYAIWSDDRLKRD